MTRAERRTHWRAIIENQATSGMSIAAYCRDIQIKQSYFYTWRRRLREQQPCAGGFLELIPGRLTEAATSGTQVKMDVKTVGRYLDILEKAFVIVRLGGAAAISATRLPARQNITSILSWYDV